MTTNRFLEGAFAPVDGELSAFDLSVTGRIPPELNGRYLRNGPNPIGDVDPDYHWFLGTGMLHGVRLRDGRAEWYRNRWVRSKEVAEALGEAWVGGPVHFHDYGPNTHVIRHAGRVLATVEAGSLPYAMTDELDTVGPCNFDGTLPGGFAAHTKLDPASGDLHAIAYYWAWDYVQHVVVDPTGRVSGTTDIPVADGPMMHDFAMTESFIVVLDLPVTFSLDMAGTGNKFPYTWNPAHQARVGLLPRQGPADVHWVEIDPCFVFHTLNAYDDAGRVVLDVCRYDKAYDVATLSGPALVTLDRWVIDPDDAKVTLQRLDDRVQEFPRIDDRLVGRRHRYGYSAVIADNFETTLSLDHGVTNALLKHDLANGTVEAHEFPAGCTVGEAVFVPSAADAEEDEGYLMALVHDPDRGAADLVILVAQDFTANPVARVHLPARIPLGFHGNWIPDQVSA